jgi:hypothetical protein
MRTTLALLVLMMGCGYREEVALFEEDFLLEKLWAVVFDGPELAPSVEWITDLDCGGGWGWTVEDGRCVDGTTWGPRYVQVARRDGEMPGRWSLAHEFAHARDLWAGGDGDPHHTSAAYQPGGTVSQGEAWLDAHWPLPIDAVSRSLNSVENSQGASLNPRAACVRFGAGGASGHENPPRAGAGVRDLRR